MGFVFLGTLERVWNSHGKRAISVRVTEDQLYLLIAFTIFIQQYDDVISFIFRMT